MKRIYILSVAIYCSVYLASAQQPASATYSQKRRCNDREHFMEQAIELSKQSVKTGGGPFGAVIVKDGKVIAKDIYFDDSFIYDQIPLDPAKRSIPSERIAGDKAIEAFQMWKAKSDKIEY